MPAGIVPMIQLTKALNAWGTSEFTDVLKEETEQLNVDQLPLQQGLSVGNYALDDKFSVMILGVSENKDFIHAKAGIFYTSIIAGCSCADDPTPISELSEYCEVQLDIDRKTGETIVALVPEQPE